MPEQFISKNCFRHVYQISLILLLLPNCQTFFLFKLKLPQSPISIFSLSHLKELFATALDFLKLEKIELGGSRGKVLSEMVFSMSEEFHDRWRTIRESKYDPLDYTNNVRLWQLPLMSHCFVIKKPRGL